MHAFLSSSKRKLGVCASRARTREPVLAAKWQFRVPGEISGAARTAKMLVHEMDLIVAEVVLSGAANAQQRSFEWPDSSHSETNTLQQITVRKFQRAVTGKVALRGGGKHVDNVWAESHYGDKFRFDHKFSLGYGPAALLGVSRSLRSEPFCLIGLMLMGWVVTVARNPEGGNGNIYRG